MYDLSIDGETFAKLVKSLGIGSKRLRIPVAPPLWMDVPSRKRPAFAGMTEVLQRSLDGWAVYWLHLLYSASSG